MRLASVTVSSMKKYAVLYVKKGGREAEHAEEDTILGIHAEVCTHVIVIQKLNVLFSNQLLTQIF
jgi:hypothetical protein